MKKEQIFSIVRHALSAIAGILVARGVLESGIAMEVLGAATGLFATVWSIFDKTVTISRVEAVLRHVLTVVGSFWAVFNPVLNEQIISAVVVLIPVILGQTDKLKPTEPIIPEETKESAI